MVLANYTDPDLENVIVPWAAACQIMGIFAYREPETEHPCTLIGLTDLSARLNVRASLGTNVLSFTTPWPLFLRMEQNVKGSFLQRRRNSRRSTCQELSKSGCGTISDAGLCTAPVDILSPPTVIVEATSRTDIGIRGKSKLTVMQADPSH